MIWRGNRQALKRSLITSHDHQYPFRVSPQSPAVQARVHSGPAELLGNSPSSKFMVPYEIETGTIS